MPDLEQTVEEHGEAIIALKNMQIEHGKRLELHTQHISNLDRAIANLSAKFDTVATQKDVLFLSQKIDENFTGLLKDALNSIPPKTAAWFVVALILVLFIAMK